MRILVKLRVAYSAPNSASHAFLTWRVEQRRDIDFQRAGEGKYDLQARIGALQRLKLLEPAKRNSSQTGLAALRDEALANAANGDQAESGPIALTDENDDEVEDAA